MPSMGNLRVSLKIILTIVVMVDALLQPAPMWANTLLETPLQPLLAWDVAPDGGVFVVDAAYRLYELDPATLTPRRQVVLLKTAIFSDRSVYLLAADQFLAVGSDYLGETRLLERQGLRQTAALAGAGPMAYDPNTNALFLAYDRALWRYALDDSSQPPAAVIPPWGPRDLYGKTAREAVVDPENRLLYVHVLRAGGSHTEHTLELFDLDTLAPVEHEPVAGTTFVLRLASEPATGATVVLRNGYDGVASSVLQIWRQGKPVVQGKLLDGQAAAVDWAHGWVYLLRQQGLWVLDREDLSLQSILPLVTHPPADLRLAPDGNTVYLFGNGWLAALDAERLTQLGIPATLDLPQVWQTSAKMQLYPTLQTDIAGEQTTAHTIFAQGQTDHGAGLYRSTDDGITWQVLTSFFAHYNEVWALSISPRFAEDQTLVVKGFQLLRSTDGGESFTVWQPPLAFTAEQEGNRDLYLLNPDSQETVRLTDDPAADETPAWSPGWTHIVFQSNRSGNWDLFSVRANCDRSAPNVEAACDLRQLTDDPADDLLPAWSPDGRYIAFVSMRAGNPEIYVMNADGSQPQRLTDSPAGDWRPAWLPDSNTLLYTSGVNGNNDLYSLRLGSEYDGASGQSKLKAYSLSPVVATSTDERDAAVALAEREGLKVLFASVAAEQTTLAYASLPTHLVRYGTLGKDDGVEIKPLPFAGVHPVWGVDGSIYWAREVDGRYRIEKISSIYTSGAETILESATFLGHPAAGPVFWRKLE